MSKRVHARAPQRAEKPSPVLNTPEASPRGCPSSEGASLEADAGSLHQLDHFFSWPLVYHCAAVAPLPLGGLLERWGVVGAGLGGLVCFPPLSGLPPFWPPLPCVPGLPP